MSRSEEDAACLLAAGSIRRVTPGVVVHGVLGGRVTGVPFETYFAAASFVRLSSPAVS